MTSRAKKRIVWSASIVGGLILLLGFIGPVVSYKEVRNFVCPVSGSTRTETIWLGYFKNEQRTVTELETWLKQRESGFKPVWQPRSTQTYFVLGRSCGTSGAPEICQLKPILNRVVQTLSDDEIAHLVAILRHGSREEQRQMIQDISEKVFERE